MYSKFSYYGVFVSDRDIITVDDDDIDLDEFLRRDAIELTTDNNLVEPPEVFLLNEAGHPQATVHYSDDGEPVVLLSPLTPRPWGVPDYDSRQAVIEELHTLYDKYLPADYDYEGNLVLVDGFWWD